MSTSAFEFAYGPPVQIHEREVWQVRDSLTRQQVRIPVLAGLPLALRDVKTFTSDDAVKVESAAISDLPTFKSASAPGTAEAPPASTSAPVDCPK